MPYDVLKHKMPEGHPIRFAGKYRTGSVCSESPENDPQLHTIAQLIGEEPCNPPDLSIGEMSPSLWGRRMPKFNCMPFDKNRFME